MLSAHLDWCPSLPYIHLWAAALTDSFAAVNSAVFTFQTLSKITALASSLWWRSNKMVSLELSYTEMGDETDFRINDVCVSSCVLP